MKFNDLFGSNESLSKANRLLASINQRIVEAKRSFPDSVSSLMEFRDEVVEYIDQHTAAMFLEDHVADTEAFIVDMIVAIKGRGVDKMPLSALEKELAENGLEIDSEFLIDFLSRIDGVTEVNPGMDEVVFDTAGPDGSDSEDEQAKDQANIKKTATKVAKDNMKDDNKGRKTEID